MLKFAKFATAAVVAVGLLGATASFGAGTLTLDNDDAWGPSAGGPFVVTTAGLPGGNGTFLTFCLEVAEGIREGQTYDASTSSVVKFEGTGSTSFPLDPDVAYLYTLFRAGTLSAVVPTFVYGTEPSGGWLQQAIWYLQDGQVAAPAAGSIGDKLVQAAAAAGWNDLGKVQVINVWALGTLPEMGRTNARQDMLIIVPTPEALVGGLGLLGVLGAARLRRRPSSL